MTRSILLPVHHLSLVSATLEKHCGKYITFFYRQGGDGVNCLKHPILGHATQRSLQLVEGPGLWKSTPWPNWCQTLKCFKITGFQITQKAPYHWGISTTVVSTEQRSPATYI